MTNFKDAEFSLTQLEYKNLFNGLRVYSRASWYQRLLLSESPQKYTAKMKQSEYEYEARKDVFVERAQAALRYNNTINAYA